MRSIGPSQAPVLTNISQYGFATEHGLHKLDTPTLYGTYLRSEHGVCIISLSARTEGQGACRAFLDSLPTDENIEFDNVVSDILAGALTRRGFTPLDDGSNSWGRNPAR